MGAAAAGAVGVVVVVVVTAVARMEMGRRMTACWIWLRCVVFDYLCCVKTRLRHQGCLGGGLPGKWHAGCFSL